MINLENLDKNKTYVGWNIGTGFISQAIQNMSKKETLLPLNQIATHIFAIVFQHDEWQVFESHLQWKGCRKLFYSTWVKDYTSDSIFVAERELNIDSLEFYANPLFNPGYSCANIGSLAIEEINSKMIFNDSPGMVCSEYIANCDNDFAISYKLSKKCYMIKPIHWQLELMKGTIK